MKTVIRTISCLTIILLTGCNEQTKSNKSSAEFRTFNQTQADSVELTKLIRQVYEWHETKRMADFPYKYDENQDSIFIGIDWAKYQDNIQVFKQTNFFSNDFLKRHKEIALTLDSSIRKAGIAWRNINDGIPIWDSGADDWCSCQDYPDNYWNNLIIDSLTIEKEYASFKWAWDNDLGGRYKVSAKKENGKWKINSLEWVNYNYTVDHYDKIMKRDKVKEIRTVANN